MTAKHLLLTPSDLEPWDGVIVDTRPAQRFALGHIPQAVNLPQAAIRVERDKATFVADSETFAEQVGAVGIDNSTPVAVYSEKGQPDAGYLAWALSYYGHQNVHLLDGGIEHWLKAGLPLSTDARGLRPKTFAASANPELRAERDWLRDHFDRHDVNVLDNRSAGEYGGQQAFAARGGHIPSAVHLEWTQVLNPDGTFKPEARLKQVFSNAGLTPDQTAVVHCQTANRSGAVYVALRLVGHLKIRVYDGSWSQWGNDPDLPVAIE